MARDLYESYQNWINTLNPETAPAAIAQPGDYASPPDFDRQPFAFSMPSAGNTAYDAEQEAERIRLLSEKEHADAEQAAIRFAGQRKYRSLIDGGARPEEALRLAGPELFWNNPAALVSSVRATREATPFEPSIVERDGAKFAVTGPNRAQLIPEIKEVQEKMPKANVDQQALLKPEISKLAAQLATLEPKVGDKTELALNPGLPAQVADIKTRLKIARDQYANFGTNWMGKASAPQAAGPVKFNGIATKAQFDMLPNGTEFTDAKGQRYRKP